ncbi:HdeD family acid-resistance protein [Aliiroseovarius sediminis]|uniref:HdeD family acid-resistance protein n=1 Tax=Aliiroseovarius sediminis TaxID=2925839 RepID=UPI001F5612E6|nr:HdeD family acid-resistance protein [Aliiroseovarius sediminis]MCI2393899.1 HdeD family acid-resistance protein [Aliiroseovarius sediminis]
MNEMIDYLQSSWWIFLLRGIAAIVFGIMAFVWPALTLSVLLVLFGFYVLIDGIFGLIDAVRYRDRLPRVWPLVLESVLGLVVGLMVLLWPGVTSLVLLMFIAAWAVVGGLIRIVLAFQIRKEITGEWVLILGGILSILFGGLLVALPQVGLVTLVWLVGFYAIAFGVLFVMLAFRLRKLGTAADTFA